MCTYIKILKAVHLIFVCFVVCKLYFRFKNVLPRIFTLLSSVCPRIIRWQLLCSSITYSQEYGWGRRPSFPLSLCKVKKHSQKHTPPPQLMPPHILLVTTASCPGLTQSLAREMGPQRSVYPSPSQVAKRGTLAGSVIKPTLTAEFLSKATPRRGHPPRIKQRFTPCNLFSF